MPEDNENASIPDDAEEDIPFPGGPSSEDVSESEGNDSPYYSIMLVFQSDTSSQARLLQSHVGIADNR